MGERVTVYLICDGKEKETMTEAEVDGQNQE